MKLDDITSKKNSPSTNKGKKETKAKPKRKGRIYKEMTYEYEEREAVVLSASGLKQKNLYKDLKKEPYHVIKIYLANLGNMDCWMMVLDDSEDENIRNPYLAHHFKPLNPTTNEENTTS